MTVSELVAKLQAYKGDATVKLFKSDLVYAGYVVMLLVESDEPSKFMDSTGVYDVVMQSTEA